jgi:hypothetical protein
MPDHTKPTAEATPRDAGEACSNCLFFIYTEPVQTTGICRKHAPIAPAGYGLTGWGTATNTDWCGDYSAMTATQAASRPAPTPRADAIGRDARAFRIMPV